MEIVPLAVDLLGPVAGRFVDLGCGEGQVLRAVSGASAIGCDISASLLALAAEDAAVVRCRLPDLGWLRADVAAAAACVLVVEHLPTLEGLFAEVARVLEPNGVFVVVMNHPAYTADGAGPVLDMSDGEFLWRWGSYFAVGSGREPAGDRSVVFHHRPLNAILNFAAGSGLALERVEERGLSPAAVARDPGLAGQEHFPRILGLRWRIPAGPNI